MAETADIIIIGGGIAGIGAAACLSPHVKVVLLERERSLATHSTGRSAAIYVRNYGNATLRALTASSEAVFESSELSETPLLTARGELLIATETQLGLLEDTLAESDGLDRLSAQKSVDLFPILRRETIAGAAYDPKARDIDVDALVQGMLRVAKQHNASILTEADARKIERKAGLWHVATDQSAIEAPILINAAGAWADQVARCAGVRPVGLTPMRRSAALLPAPEGQTIADWPMVGSIDETWYCKPQSGKLMVSPADEDPVEPHDAWPDDMVIAEGLDRFERAMTISVTRIAHSWAGLRSFVADRTPVCGFAPDAEGFFWLAGQGGYGIQTAPALSKLAADLILQRDVDLPQPTVEALSPMRFAE